MRKSLFSRDQVTSHYSWNEKLFLDVRTELLRAWHLQEELQVDISIHSWTNHLPQFDQLRMMLEFCKVLGAIPNKQPVILVILEKNCPVLSTFSNDWCIQYLLWLIWQPHNGSWAPEMRLLWLRNWYFCCCLVAQLCSTLCKPVDYSMPGLPVHHQPPEFTQTHVHRVSDAIQPSHPLPSPSLAFSLSQHQGFFQ